MIVVKNRCLVKNGLKGGSGGMENVGIKVIVKVIGMMVINRPNLGI